ncbi:MAG: DUF2202 domain-containing protein [Spirochaetales bacterium]|nr:DUF2202 domain-containing protein [Spirochaetales bacterium]
MKKTMMILMMMVLAGTAVFANGNDEYANGKGRGQGQNLERGMGRGAGGQGQGRNGNGGMNNDERFAEEFSAYMSADELKNLDADEQKWLAYMYQEEKLARDVYAELYKVWNVPVFGNISESEQQHMDSIAFALDAAGMNVETLKPGQFSDPELAALYTTLVAEGKKDLTAAFKTGATVEDLDIADLQKAVAETDNKSLAILYQNLMKGSRNHLRSFVYQLDREGVDYTAQYISPEYFEKILSMNRETAPISE